MYLSLAGFAMGDSALENIAAVAEFRRYDKVARGAKDGESDERQQHRVKAGDDRRAGDPGVAENLRNVHRGERHARQGIAASLAGPERTKASKEVQSHGPAPSALREKIARGGQLIPRLRENPKTPLAKRRDPDSTERMIRPGFLDIESRQNLIELARDGLAAHRLARRANALVLLDDGMSCEAIAKVLLLDDDTIRTWYRLYEEDGIEGLTNFSYEGSA